MPLPCVATFILKSLSIPGLSQLPDQQTAATSSFAGLEGPPDGPCWLHDELAQDPRSAQSPGTTAG
jgi:hypothetical protein